MGFYSTTLEQEKPHQKTSDCAQKTASGNFFASNRNRTYQIERNPLETQQEKLTTTTETASGVFLYKYRHYSAELGRWPGRDPLGERGGMNLYVFVGNSPVTLWDRLGLESTDDDSSEDEAQECKMCCLKSILVNFNSSSVAPRHPSPGQYNHQTGRRFSGTMTAMCEDGSIAGQWDVFSGGYRTKTSKVKQGDDTALDEGDYEVSTSRSGGTKGYLISPTPGRSLIKIHFRRGSAGTHGCICDTSQDYFEFDKLMDFQRKSCSKRSAPLHIRYLGASPEGSQGGGKSGPPSLPFPPEWLDYEPNNDESDFPELF